MYFLTISFIIFLGIRLLQQICIEDALNEIPKPNEPLIITLNLGGNLFLYSPDVTYGRSIDRPEDEDKYQSQMQKQSLLIQILKDKYEVARKEGLEMKKKFDKAKSDVEKLEKQLKTIFEAKWKSDS